MKPATTFLLAATGIVVLLYAAKSMGQEKPKDEPKPPQPPLPLPPAPPTLPAVPGVTPPIPIPIPPVKPPGVPTNINSMALTTQETFIRTVPLDSAPKVTERPLPSNVVVEVKQMGLGANNDWVLINVPAATAWVLFDAPSDVGGCIKQSALSSDWTPKV